MIPAPSALRILAVLLGAAAAVSGQQTVVAYPQDTTTGSYGNLVPLGHNASGGGVEARYQVLVPAAFLPSSGGAILAMEVVAHAGFVGTFTATYTSLQVTMSHLPSPSSFPTLSSTFAVNLPAPQVVLSLANQTISYPPGQWHSLPLQQPFVHNGQDHLVIEFQKVVAGPVSGALYMVTSRDERGDLPAPQVRFGTQGSGAATAAVATATAYPIRLRLVYAGDVPTTVLRSPQAGTVYFGNGTSFDIETHGAALAPMWLAVDFAAPTLGGRSSWVTPVVQGDCWLVAGPALVVAPLAFLPAAGPRPVLLSIPADPTFAGVSMVFQSVVIHPLHGFQWSSATDATIR